MTNRIWTDEARTLLVEMWPDGTVTVATRATPDATWGPPVYCSEDGPSRYVLMTTEEADEVFEVVVRLPLKHRPAAFLERRALTQTLPSR